MQEVKATRISSQSTQKGGKDVSPLHPLLLTTCDIPGTHFCYRMIEPQGHCGGRKDYINEKLQLLHLEWNSRPSGL